MRFIGVCACVRACVRACVCVCVRARARACVCVWFSPISEVQWPAVGGFGSWCRAAAELSRYRAGPVRLAGRRTDLSRAPVDAAAKLMCSQAPEIGWLQSGLEPGQLPSPVKGPSQLPPPSEGSCSNGR